MTVSSHQRSTVHSILKIVFLEIQNKAIRPVLSGPVTIVDCNVTLNQTAFIHNRVEAGITVEVFKSIRVQIIEILVFNNSYPNGIMLKLASFVDVVNLSINSSDFSYNNGSDLLCGIAGSYISIEVHNSNFTNGNPLGAPGSVILGFAAAVESVVTFHGVQFSNNHVNDIDDYISDIYGKGVGAIYIDVLMEMLKLT